MFLSSRNCQIELHRSRHCRVWKVELDFDPTQPTLVSNSPHIRSKILRSPPFSKLTAIAKFYTEQQISKSILHERDILLQLQVDFDIPSNE
jgi:hypothetical protein